MTDVLACWTLVKMYDSSSDQSHYNLGKKYHCVLSNFKGNLTQYQGRGGKL